MKAAINSLKDKTKYLPEPLIYKVDKKLLCKATLSKFYELSLDDGTKQFLQEYCSDVEGLGTSFLNTLLRCCYSVTDANAILHRGQMHVLSKEQIFQLFSENHFLENYLKNPSTLLDIGSGDGCVTEKLGLVLCNQREDRNSIANLWRHRIVTTEVSQPMVKRLKMSGYAAVNTTNLTRAELLPHLRVEKPPNNLPAFDVVSLFNVLDRCDKPLSLLRQIRELLLPEDDFDGTSNERGILILALVLPWSAFVESGTGQKKPTEKLQVRGPHVFWPVIDSETDLVPGENENLNYLYTPTRNRDSEQCACCNSFEEAVDWFVWNVLVKEGWEVVRWSRVPYISAGDMNSPYYCLNNAIFILKPTIIT